MQEIAKAATDAWTAVQWLLNAALSANPIGLVVDRDRRAGRRPDRRLQVLRHVPQHRQRRFQRGPQRRQNRVRLDQGQLAAAAGDHRRADRSRDAGGRQALGHDQERRPGRRRDRQGAIVGAWDAIRSTTSSVWGAVAGFVSGAVANVKALLNGLASWVAGFASGAWSTALNGSRRCSTGSAKAAGRGPSGQGRLQRAGRLHRAGSSPRSGSAATDVANAIKAPINAAHQGLEQPRVSRPRRSTSRRSISPLRRRHRRRHASAAETIGFPDLPMLAQAAVSSTPRPWRWSARARAARSSAPRSLLRQIVGEQSVNVRVFIGDTELKGLVDTQIDQANTNLARGLLAGGRADGADRDRRDPRSRSVRLDHVVTATGVAVTFSRTGPSEHAGDRPRLGPHPGRGRARSSPTTSRSRSACR